jgi:hypothetical protein
MGVGWAGERSCGHRAWWESGQAWSELSSFRRWVLCCGFSGAHRGLVTLGPAGSWQWRHDLQILFLPSDTEGISQGVELDTEEESLCLSEGVGTKQSLIKDHKLKVKMGMHSGPPAVYCTLRLSPALFHVFKFTVPSSGNYGQVSCTKSKNCMS